MPPRRSNAASASSTGAAVPAAAPPRAPPAMKGGKQYGAFGVVTLEKAKPDLSQRRKKIMPQVMLALVTAAASAAAAAAAAAIVYLAHKGNVRANWFAICQQLDSFCECISGSLVGSFAAMVVLILLIFLSAIALARR